MQYYSYKGNNIKFKREWLNWNFKLETSVSKKSMSNPHSLLYSRANGSIKMTPVVYWII